MAAKRPRRCRVKVCDEPAFERSTYCIDHLGALDTPGDVLSCALTIHDTLPRGGDCRGHASDPVHEDEWE